MNRNVPQLSVGGILVGSLRVLGQGLPLFLQIAIVTSLGLMAAAASVVAINWGISSTPANIDPNILIVTTTPKQFAVIAVGVLFLALVLSYAAAAIISAAAGIVSGNRISLRTALSRTRAKGMQLFWMQWLVNILSVRYSPAAAPVLWLLIAPAIPMAVLENAGPVDAVERTLERLRGNRLRMLAIELLVMAPAVIIPAALTWELLPGHALDITTIPTFTRMAFALPTVIVLLFPVILMFIALTLVHQQLSGESGLHARGASNVIS